MENLKKRSKNQLLPVSDFESLYLGLTLNQLASMRQNIVKVITFYVKIPP